LWKARCAFAHADLVTNIATQRTFYAPSWSRSQYQILATLISAFKEILGVEVRRLNTSA
jgi:hypothetical protein